MLVHPVRCAFAELEITWKASGDFRGYRSVKDLGCAGIVKYDPGIERNAGGFGKRFLVPESETLGGADGIGNL